MINFPVGINQEDKNDADGQYNDPMADGNVTAGRNGSAVAPTIRSNA